jgi:hypothetical protein
MIEIALDTRRFYIMSNEKDLHKEVIHSKAQDESL